MNQNASNLNMVSRGAVPRVQDPLVRHVNLTINNPSGAAAINAEIDTTYDTAILHNASENMCAVVSFTLPMQNLPLFVFPVEPNQTPNVNVSTLQVGVCHNMVQANVDAGQAVAVTSYTTPLTWVPQKMGQIMPIQNQTRQVITPYYYCYSFEHFVNLVNDAIDTTYTLAGSPGLSKPEFSYDDALKTFTWTIPTAFSGNVVASATGWSVCWNEDFDNLVNNFNTIENGDLYILEDTNSALTNTVGTDIILSQDYPTTDYFNSAERILVTTTSIPIAQELFPGPTGQYQGLSNRETILVDVNLDFDNNVTSQRSILKYVNSTDMLQMNDMISTLPVQRIGVKFRWVDSLNNVYDIPVSKNEVVTCKIGFYNKKLLLN